MVVKSEQYRDQLIGLLPRGDAWRRDPESWLGRLLHGIAEELARIDARAVDLQNEADPRTCYETLADWERVCGLPDECTGAGETLAERKSRIWAKIIESGGQSRRYFRNLAAALGYDVEIEEYDRLRVGDRVMERCCGEDWMHAFAVVAPETTIRYARASALCAGERLATWGDDALECVIARAKPAHATVLHIYE